MQTSEITIRVPQGVADVYQNASPEQRRKMELYMALRLSVYESAPSVSFEESWQHLGGEAEANGLTEAALNDVLREIDTERHGDSGAGRAEAP